MIFRKALSAVTAAVMILLALFSVCLCACDDKSDKFNQPHEAVLQAAEGELMVHFIDVGHGDCILIELPDGKNALIDSGDSGEQNEKTVTEYIKNRNITTLDYLVATHPDSDHIGAMGAIFAEFEILNAYVPYILSQNYTPLYAEFIDCLTAEGSHIYYSEIYRSIVSQNPDYSYIAAFLTPNSYQMKESPYKDYNSAIVPSGEQSNDLSPIIYLEYAHKRMLFTGDAGVSQEKIAVNNYLAGLYKNAFLSLGFAPDLSSIDLLKVPHHGGGNSCCDEFLSLVKPKNAVISADNGQPSSNVLNTLVSYNPQLQIYRTDIDGTVVIAVSPDNTRELSVFCAVNRLT